MSAYLSSLKNYLPYFFYFALIFLVFLFVFAVIKLAASAATASRYKSSTSGLGSVAEPTDEEIKADAKAAQDRDLLQLLGLIFYIFFCVLVALNGGTVLPNGAGVVYFR